METTVSSRLEHGGSFFFGEPCEREKDGDHDAGIVPRDLSRPVLRLTIW